MQLLLKERADASFVVLLLTISLLNLLAYVTPLSRLYTKHTWKSCKKEPLDSNLMWMCALFYIPAFYLIHWVKVYP